MAIRGVPAVKVESGAKKLLKAADELATAAKKAGLDSPAAREATQDLKVALREETKFVNQSHAAGTKPAIAAFENASGALDHVKAALDKLSDKEKAARI